ncbi:hypothetical protein MKW92_037740 [Papaver armeniacum]|nr:hypothetical protein MKW92_037740 [Papaver armeniacum]
MVSKQTLPTSSTSSIAACRSKDNRLSAGYLAHEFLTEGTLLGIKVEGGTIMARTQQQHSSYADSKPI